MAVQRVWRAAWSALGILFVCAAPVGAQPQDANAAFAALGWQAGPTKGELGDVATVDVPEGYQFVGRAGAAKFMELTQNPSNGTELGVLLHSAESWFVVFEFSAEGYVKDDDRTLDVEAILDSIREGTEQSNKIRKERGWPTMHIDGWHQAPFYDPKTNNLTWSIRGSSEGDSSINHSTRLLGRRGVMKVDLVVSPEDVGTGVPAFNTVLTGFSFNAGQRYAEFTRGDKVAEYGLTGLIVGGAGVALAKTGLLQKFWKVIVLGFIALAGVVKRILGGLAGRSREVADQSTNA